MTWNDVWKRHYHVELCMFFISVFYTTWTQLALCWKFSIVLWYFEKKDSMQNSFCSLLPHTVFPLLPRNYDFEANACGWFPWYKITSFTERALQPALIGHDMFQGCVCKHRCPSIAGIQQLIRHVSKGKHWVSLSEWQTQAEDEYLPGIRSLAWYCAPFLNCFVSLLTGPGGTSILCSIWWPWGSGRCYLCLCSPTRKLSASGDVPPWSCWGSLPGLPCHRWAVCAEGSQGGMACPCKLWLPLH